MLFWPLQEFQRRLAGSGIENFAAQPGIAKTSIFGKIDQQPGKPVGTTLVRHSTAQHATHLSDVLVMR